MALVFLTKTCAIVFKTQGGKRNRSRDRHEKGMCMYDFYLRFGHAHAPLDVVSPLCGFSLSLFCNYHWMQCL